MRTNSSGSNRVLEQQGAPYTLGPNMEMIEGSIYALSLLYAWHYPEHELAMRLRQQNSDWKPRNTTIPVRR